MFRVIVLCLVTWMSSNAFSQVNPKELAPTYEGVYIVNLECQPGDTSPKCSKIQRNLELVVLSHAKSVGVSIVDPQTMKARYVFDAYSVKENGREIEGVNYTTPHPVGEISITMDYENNRIRGWLRDPEYKYDVKIYGRLVTSPAVYYAQEGAFPELFIGALVGDYTGNVGGRAGILAIRASSTGGMPLATFYDYTGENRIDFTWTEIVGKRRIFNLLIDNAIQGTHLKWTLGYSVGPDGLPILKGVAYSSYAGSYYGLQFNHR